MDALITHPGALALFGAALLLLVLVVWVDRPAFLAHVLIAVGALSAFPTWSLRLAAFIGGHVAAIALGLALRHLLSSRSPPGQD